MPVRIFVALLCFVLVAAAGTVWAFAAMGSAALLIALPLTLIASAGLLVWRR